MSYTEIMNNLEMKILSEISHHSIALSKNGNDEKKEAEIQLKKHLMSAAAAQRTCWQDKKLKPSEIRDMNPHVFPDENRYFLMEGVILRDGEEVSLHPSKIEGMYPGIEDESVLVRVLGTIHVLSSGEAVLSFKQRSYMIYPIKSHTKEEYMYGNIITSILAPL